MRRRRTRQWLGGSALAWACLAGIAWSDLAPEPVGQVAKLPEQTGPHWFWLSDILLHRTALFDADHGELLGTISSGTAGLGFIIAPLFSPDRREIYLAESYYSRGVRGVRTDVVTVYDGRTLNPLAEIAIPPKRAEYFPGNAANALSDDGRFLAIFNVTPATSLSIVDLQARAFTAEIQMPGCGLLFPAGPRRFFGLCANGEALVIRIDDSGREAGVERTKAFFDAAADPLSEKAVRRGKEWIFLSFGGMVHTVDVGGEALTFGKPWSIFSEAEKQASWRIGGAQHLAIHGPTGRLYVLLHQGPVDTHKAPGQVAWVYDLASQQRIKEIPLPNPLESFVAGQARLPIGSWSRWGLSKVLPHTGIDRLLVTQDAQPILLASGSMPPSVSVLDATTGTLLRDVDEPGLALSLIGAP